jgi:hypothetical protein
LSDANLKQLEDYSRAGLISKRTYDRLFDKRIEAIALEWIKKADPATFLTHEELKARFGIKD